jgi:hypothetical protein
MNILAEVSFDLSASSFIDWLTLNIKVKFKEEGKIFKTRLESTVVSNIINTNEEFYEKAVCFLKDEKSIEKKVRSMIEEHYKGISDNMTDAEKQEELLKLIKSSKLKINVKL